VIRISESTERELTQEPVSQVLEIDSTLMLDLWQGLHLLHKHYRAQVIADFSCYLKLETSMAQSLRCAQSNVFRT
jgi:hypothetical protein